MGIHGPRLLANVHVEVKKNESDYYGMRNLRHYVEYGKSPHLCLLQMVR